MSSLLRHVPPGAALFLLTALAAGAASLGEPVSLAVGESAEVADLVLTFVEVASDNRCPADVQCIVGGEAKVVLRLEASDGTETDLRIDVPPGGPGKGRYEGYEITVEVEPQPKGGERLDPESYVVTVVVESDADAR